MATFPRTLLPHDSGTLRYSFGPLVSVTNRGKQQIRATTGRGFMWKETWAALEVGDPDVEALLAFIRFNWRTGTLVNVLQLATPGSGLTPNGTGTAGVTVSGASQVGSSLVTAGWPLSTTGVVRAGDLLKVYGYNNRFIVTADANSDGAGIATLAIDPTILSGASPVDGDSVYTTANLLRCRIAAYDIPDAPPHHFISGMTVTFQEAP